MSSLGADRFFEALAFVLDAFALACVLATFVLLAVLFLVVVFLVFVFLVVFFLVVMFLAVVFFLALAACVALLLLETRVDGAEGVTRDPTHAGTKVVTSSSPELFNWTRTLEVSERPFLTGVAMAR